MQAPLPPLILIPPILAFSENYFLTGTTSSLLHKKNIELAEGTPSVVLSEHDSHNSIAAQVLYILE
jgi:hypothetical protein